MRRSTLWLLVASVGLALAAAVPVTDIGPRSTPRVHWVNSSDTDLAQFILGIWRADSPDGDPLLQTTIPTTGIDTAPGVPNSSLLGALIGALADASYVIRIRAVDTAGNIGMWSAPYEFRYNSTPPGPPTGLRITTASSGDVNGDGNINIADMMYLQTYLFAGGPAPVACG